MNEIKYAPVIIPTLCRHEHFKRGIESLKKNSLAKYTDVYIALDYPAKDEHWEGYKKICEYLDDGDFSVFKSFNITRRKKNYGVGLNGRELSKSLMDRYDRSIYAEDDIEFSPNFLEYMDKCLAKYEDNDDIIAITGYSYPLNYEHDEGANIIFQSSVFPSWGVGYWQRKYGGYRDEILSGYLPKNFDKACKTGVLKKLIDRRRSDYIVQSLGGGDNTFITSTTDVSFGIYMTLKNKYVVSPTLSKTRNCGMDGSGVNFPKVRARNGKHYLSYDYNNQPIDMSTGFEPCPDSVIRRDENNRVIDDFLRVPLKHKILEKTAFTAYRILGLKRYKALAKKISDLAGRKNASFKYLEEYKG